MRLSGVTLLVLTLASSPAAARVERFAVIIGNNRGNAADAPLRYAEADAEKIHDILTRLGGFPVENSVLLRGPDDRSVRRVLIAMNERIRAVTEDPGVEPMLLVFYSGHADARDLHLGETGLALRELEQLVRGSAALLRLLVLDACRSGAVTRVKGGTPSPPFDIQIDDRLAGQGFVILTAAAAGEDAQESDDIKGSFFTHHLATGLLGAADANADGTVVLEEAYRYAYGQTLRSSSRSLAGVQHPTFRYDLRGRGDTVLTRLNRDPGSVASLTFPADYSFVVFRDDEAGPVIAEIDATNPTRRLVLPPGRYHVRGRAERTLLDGTVDLERGAALVVAIDRLERTEYARLVRKGHASMSVATGVQAGYWAHTSLWGGASLCHGPTLGLPIGLRQVTVTPRARLCRIGFDNDYLESNTVEWSADVKLAHVFDLARVSLGVGVTAGAAYLRQTFRTAGVAPERNVAAGTVGVVASATFDLPAAFFVLIEAEGRGYLLAARDPDELARDGGVGRIVGLSSVALGWYL